MNFTLLSIFCFIATILADSDYFTLHLDTKKDKLSNLGIYIEDNNIMVGETKESLSGQILDDGSLQIDNGTFFGITKNYFTLVNESTDATVAFSIGDDGKLEYNGKDKFKVVASGQNNVWIFGSKDATTQSEDYDVKVKCTKVDGKNAKKFSSGASQTQLTSFTLVLVATFIAFEFLV